MLYPISARSSRCHIDDTFVYTNRYSNSSTESFSPLGPGMHLPTNSTIQVKADVHHSMSRDSSPRHVPQYKSSYNGYPAQPDVLHRKNRPASDMVRLPDSVSSEHLVHHALYPESKSDDTYDSSWAQLGQQRYGTGFDVSLIYNI